MRDFTGIGRLGAVFGRRGSRGWLVFSALLLRFGLAFFVFESLPYLLILLKYL